MTPGWVRIFLISVVVFWGAAQFIIGCLASSFSPAVRIGLVSIGVCSIIVATDRDTYLPFLGCTALPSSVLKPTVSEPKAGTIRIEISSLPANATLVWWASKPPSPSSPATSTAMDAYSDYSNSGVVPVDMAGTATIYLRCPRKYWVPGMLGARRVLPTHVHYRFTERRGILSSVRTKQIACSVIQESLDKFR